MSKLNHSEFIIKANKVHNNKFDYSKTIYKNSREKIIIICPIHGDFLQNPANHLFGSSCPECSQIEKTLKQLGTKEDFLKRSKLKHGDKYNYDKVIYLGTKVKTIITCPIHGDFEQIPESHMLGKGCLRCSGKQTDTSEFIRKAKLIHDEARILNKLQPYEYLNSIYTDARAEIIITCNIHGNFKQLVCNHLSGSGCPKCSLIKNGENRLSNTIEFIEKANLIHNYEFDYSKVDYKNSQEKIIIICKKHGEFTQTPGNHLNSNNGQGCPQCNFESLTSKLEREIQDFLKSISPFEIILNDREILEGQELDIYIPEKQLAIEFNGLYWHSELKKETNYHIEKTNLCESKNIQLIHIFEDEWINKQDIVKSRLMNLFGLNQTKIFARKCKIQEITIDQTRIFLEQNHIQGFVGSKISIGLFFGNDLVSLMTFGGLRKNLGSVALEGEYELLRFCNKLNTTVIGSASRLFKHFIKTKNPERIISYADRRWSQGNLYEKLGFNFLRNSAINYFYIFGQTRKNRFNFRKDILISEYGCKPEDTEHNFCFNQGWYRIYDCGNKVYEFLNI